ncbi:ABC transporter substrate-binding protein [Paenibacillus baekrokdamisoli]|uniref:ABC transporter substrate-binding protein n=1 Tax=Paenibacillus baekrokdamisoli TaxID=1712516 RepID=A0A3G9J193_9BACL|nr:extracellular solute-binding protein [Paenibacillus baekrokdamisoli]MBB3069469.1 ABC-type glycerol-3-phosphate transport system substrate-binding protein [Paenibacillus baekrokdamisoli]BBH24957.1 ABC transporter substrate-binding protein [Paenibacillus baekrokdamisoli]
MRISSNNKAILIAIVLIIGVLLVYWRVAYGSVDGQQPAGTGFEEMNIPEREGSYGAYYAQHEGQVRPDTVIKVEAEHYTEAEGMTVEIVDGHAGSPGESIITQESGTVHWQIEVPEEGLYNIAIRYYPINGKSSSIERQLLINGVSPFDGAERLAFPRIWSNALSKVAQDNRGNDLRPGQIENPMWQEEPLKDMEGYYTEPYAFYFKAGVNKLSLVSLREPMMIDYIKLYQIEKPLTYEQLLADYEERGYKPALDQMIQIQGEDASMKSSPMLYPLMDRSSPATEPYHVSKMRVNTIGGQNWRLPGDWITWSINVPETGLYQIAVKNKQNFVQGMDSARKLYIDGQIPFKEMEQIRFKYDSNWKMTVMGDEEPYLFYLAKGKHELKLEVTLGDISRLLRVVENSLREINEIYRTILMIVGSVPDRNRDYRLQAQIPETVAKIAEQSKLLAAAASEMDRISGMKSERSALLTTLSRQLADMAERPDSIPQRMDQFKANMGGLGTWMLSVREQALEIDYLVVASPGAKLPKADAAWWEKTNHELLSFGYSFLEDYNSIGDISDKDEAITVWIGAGRDQAQVLKAMIDEQFTPQTNVKVNLKLVQMGVLLPSILSGTGPDVAMQVGSDIPVNFAARNASQDLSIFPDFTEVSKRFMDSAIVPFRYDGGTYGLPEQQLFPMLFYRKDILTELKLDVPQTWEDVYRMIPVLQKNNMEFGLPIEGQSQSVTQLPPNDTFMMFLYQNNELLYKNNGAASNLDSKKAVQAFERWTELYTSYKLPLQYDFSNRFRIGEVPIGIAPYSMYNMLSVFAPEIRGLWEFVPVPGTQLPDGTIRRDTGSGGSATVMMESAKDKQGSWEFMKWWTDKETQVRFGREMEALMGAAARYPTANVEALADLPWPVKDYQNLIKQWQWVQGIPEVPGGYFTGRHLTNAFRETVIEGANARESLLDYMRYINEEIQIKRKEFGLDRKEQ